MIKATFKHTRIIEGFKYHEGKTYEMDDKFANHPYFLALVNNKEVSVMTDAVLSNHSAFGGSKKTLPTIKDAPQFLESEVKDQSASSEDSLGDESEKEQESKPAQPNHTKRKG